MLVEKLWSSAAIMCTSVVLWLAGEKAVHEVQRMALMWAHATSAAAAY